MLYQINIHYKYPLFSGALIKRGPPPDFRLLSANSFHFTLHTKPADSFPATPMLFIGTIKHVIISKFSVKYLCLGSRITKVGLGSICLMRRDVRG